MKKNTIFQVDIQGDPSEVLSFKQHYQAQLTDLLGKPVENTFESPSYQVHADSYVEQLKKISNDNPNIDFLLQYAGQEITDPAGIIAAKGGVIVMEKRFQAGNANTYFYIHGMPTKAPLKELRDAITQIDQLMADRMQLLDKSHYGVNRNSQHDTQEMKNLDRQLEPFKREDYLPVEILEEYYHNLLRTVVEDLSQWPREKIKIVAHHIYNTYDLKPLHERLWPSYFPETQALPLFGVRQLEAIMEVVESLAHNIPLLYESFYRGSEISLEGKKELLELAKHMQLKQDEIHREVVFHHPVIDVLLAKDKFLKRMAANPIQLTVYVSKSDNERGLQEYMEYYFIQEGEIANRYTLLKKNSEKYSIVPGKELRSLEHFMEKEIESGERAARVIDRTGKEELAYRPEELSRLIRSALQHEVKLFSLDSLYKKFEVNQR